MGITLGEVELEGKLPDIRALQEKFPFAVSRVLGIVGYRAAIQLYDENFTGQKLTYHPRGETTKGKGRAAGMPASRSGRPLVNYTVSFRKQEVRISSFPVNLFETGRKLRSGKKQAGLGVMRSAKSKLRVMAYAEAGMKKVINDPEPSNPFKEFISK
ncbi:MAG: hypothetical protein LBO04_01230 [Spirochaetaceae bacterium]|jgi:hypothetical protein|nr:hypothetical protein [Spirochaetaceae bacterium]